MYLFRGFVIHMTSYCNTVPGVIVVYVGYIKILKQTVEQSLPCDIIRVNVIIVCTYCFC
jgi:hypothetical protein